LTFGERPYYTLLLAVLSYGLFTWRIMTICLDLAVEQGVIAIKHSCEQTCGAGLQFSRREWLKAVSGRHESSFECEIIIFVWRSRP